MKDVALSSKPTSTSTKVADDSYKVLTARNPSVESSRGSTDVEKLSRQSTSPAKPLSAPSLAPQQTIIRFRLGTNVDLRRSVTFSRTLRKIASQPGWRWTRWGVDADDAQWIIVVVGWKSMAPESMQRIRPSSPKPFEDMDKIVAGPHGMNIRLLVDEAKLPLRRTTELTVVSGTAYNMDNDIHAQCLELEEGLQQMQQQWKKARRSEVPSFSAAWVEPATDEDAFARTAIVLSSRLSDAKTTDPAISDLGTFPYGGALGTALEQMQAQGAALTTHRIRFQPFEPIGMNGDVKTMACSVM